MASLDTTIDGVGFELIPTTPGLPTVAGTSLSAALTAASAGGAPTEAFFEAINAAAGFWSMLASGAITFGMGVDPENRLVALASNGNVDLRLAAVYSGGDFTAPLPRPGPVIATVTVSLGLTGLGLTEMWAADLSLTALPEGVTMTGELFAGLTPTLYLAIEQSLQAMAQAIAEACTVVSPAVDPVGIAGTVLTAASATVIRITGLITQKIAFKFIQVTFTRMALSYAAIGVLQAIPSLIKVLAHEMTASILVYNTTGQTVTLDLQAIEHGKLSVDASLTTLPAAQTLTNPVGQGDCVVDYSTNFQFTNSNQLGAIGTVFTLSSPSWALPARALISVPWAGTNTIWLGASDASASTLWSEYSSVNTLLTTSVDVSDDVSVTMAINALSGKTLGAYFYSVLIVVQPR